MKYLITLLLLIPLMMSAQLRLSIESGTVYTQYNDVQVPNGDVDAGTLFSYSDDFTSEGSPLFIRAEIAYTINDKHTIEATAVPLLLNYNISTDKPIDFAGATFQGTDVVGQYKFNTYRFSYRYRLVDNSKLRLGLGASLLVRDARIALSQSTVEAEDTDLGYVPLVSFELLYTPYERLGFLLKGDALVGPVGRAEDVFAGVLYDLYKDNVKLKAGYRLIEGGADVDQVYNFAYFHFADIGLTFTL